MKTRVGEYKGKVIVEGGENPKNELRPHEILKENLSEDLFFKYRGIRYGIDERSSVFYKKHYLNENKSLVYGKVFFIIPNSPILGKIGTASYFSTGSANFSGYVQGHLFDIDSNGSLPSAYSSGKTYLYIVNSRSDVDPEAEIVDSGFDVRIAKFII